MRLPDIRYKTGVRSLGRHDIMAPVAVARAESQAVQSVVGALSGVAMDYYKREITKDINKNDVEMAKAETRWVQENPPTRVYSPDEIPEDIPVQRTEMVTDEATGESYEVNREIPAHEVQPALKKKFIDDQIRNLTPNIRSNRIGTQWAQDKTIIAERAFASDSMRALRTKDAYDRDQHDKEMELAVIEENWVVAEEIAKTYPGTDVEKGLRVRGVRNAKDKSDLNEILASRDLEALKTTYGRLRQEKFFTALSDKERVTYLSAYETSIAKAEASLKEKNTLKDKLILQDARDITTLLNSGSYVPPEAVNSALANLGNVTEGDTAVIPRGQLINALRFSKEAAEFRLLSAVHREAVLDEYRKNVKTTADSQRLKKLTSLNHELNSRLGSDTLEYGNDSGLFKVARIDIQQELAAKNSEMIGGWLHTRLNQANIAHNKFGTFTGLLTKSEVPILANWLSQASVDNQLWLAGVVRGSLGIDSGLFFQQLDSKAGVEGRFSIAGELYSQGAEGSARLVLEGQQIRKNSPEFLSKVKNDILLVMAERFGNTYQNDWDRRGKMREAVLDVYARLAEQSGNVDAFEEEWAQQAIDSVTGGILEMNNSNFEAPFYGITQQTFDRWIDTTDASYIGTLGEPENYTNNQVWTRIKDGRFQLKSIGKNAYALYDPTIGERGAVLMDKKSKQPFVFRYNPDALTTAQADLKAKANRVADRLRKGLGPEPPTPRERYEAGSLTLFD